MQQQSVYELDCIRGRRFHINTPGVFTCTDWGRLLVLEWQITEQGSRAEFTAEDLIDEPTT